jgi:hypothetical protein
MQYLKVIYLLPEDSQKWGSSLYDLFMNSVTPKIMKGILASTSYLRPDFRKLVTGQYHRNCLVKLKNKAEKVNKVLREQEDRLRETCRELEATGPARTIGHPPTAPHPTLSTRKRSTTNQSTRSLTTSQPSTRQSFAQREILA